MDELRKITLQQLFDCEEDWHKTVVFKDLPTDLGEEKLQLFLESVVDDGDVEALCRWSEGSQATMVVFKEPVGDIVKYHAALQKRKLNGNLISMEKLGKVRGVFLSRLPPRDDIQEFLTLYFESKRRCGASCEVEDVKCSLKGTCAAVVIQDVEDIKMVLRQKTHIMQDTTVAVEPYFPPYHDYIIDRASEETTFTDSDESDEPDMSQLEKSDTDDNIEKSDTDDNNIDTEKKSDTGDEEEDKDEEEEEEEEEEIDDEDESILSKDQTNSPELEKFQCSNQQSSQGQPACQTKPGKIEGIEKSAKGTFKSQQEILLKNPPTLLKQKGTVKGSKETYFNLFSTSDENVPFKEETSSKCIVDTSQPCPSKKLVTCSASVSQPVPCKQPVSLIDLLIEEGEQCDPDQTLPEWKTTPERSSKAFSQPSIQPEPQPRELFETQEEASSIGNLPSQQMSQSSLESNPLYAPKLQTQPRYVEGFCTEKADGRSSSEMCVASERREAEARVPPFITKKQNQEEVRQTEKKKINKEFLTDQVGVPLSKLHLLKIMGYGSKTSQYVKVHLKEKQNVVVIKADSQQAITEEKLKLYECLHQICEKTDPLSEERAKLLSSQASTDYIKFLCKKANLVVHVFVSNQDGKLHSVATNETDAEEGIKLVKVKLQSRYVKLRPGQVDLVSGEKWSAFKETLNNKEANVFLSSDQCKIIVESLKGKEAEAMRKKVVEFLKANVVKVATSIELNGAKAKCFDRCLRRALENSIKERQGTLNVTVVKQDYPMKLSVTVQGEESVIKETNRVLDQIWHEIIDFSKVTSNDEWLLMRGLNGEHGRPFFKGFQKEHNCFIDVTPEGQVQPPAMQTIQNEVTGPASNMRIENQEEWEASPDREDTLQTEPIYNSERSFCQSSKMSKREALQSVEVGRSISETERDRDDNPYNPFGRRQRQSEFVSPVYERRQSRSMLARFMPTFQYDEDCDEDCSYTISMNNNPVTLQKGIIANFKADCLVSIVGHKGDLREGAVSKALLKVGGMELNTRYQTKRTNHGGKIIDVRACGGLKLNCQRVVHVTLQKAVSDCSQEIQNVMGQVFQVCVRRGLNSLAIPPLGVGRMYQYPCSTVAQAMLQATQNFLSTNPNMVVTFVVYDFKTFSEFKREFESWEGNKTKPGLFGTLQSPMIPYLAVRTKLPIRGQIDPISQQTRSTSTLRSQRESRLVKSYNDQRKKVKAPRQQSRFSKESADKKLTVVVYAESKDRCIQARTQLCQAMRNTFLFQEEFAKAPKISKEAKEKMVAIITKYKVKSVKAKSGYVIKGQMQDVNSAIKEMYRVLLATGGQAESSERDSRSRRARSRPGTVEYMNLHIEEGPDVPHYWKNFKPGNPVKTALTDVKLMLTGKNHIKVTLKNTDPENAAILNLINNTWEAANRGKGKDAAGLDKLLYNRMHVTSIQRIENLELYEKYAGRRNVCFRYLIRNRLKSYPSIEQLRGCSKKIESLKYIDPVLQQDLNPCINELFFFHGTKSENIDVICEKGLDNRLASGIAMFGQGIYGAEIPSKADQYTDDKAHRTMGHGQPKQMFLMRMILGNAYLCSDPNPVKYKVPPCAKCYKHLCKDHNENFDSVVGDNGKLFREFVVYEKEQCYPEYLITYERLP